MATANNSIPVSCKCGKAFRVKASAAGRNVRCPACKSPVNVPASGEPDIDLSEVLGDPIPLPKPVTELPPATKPEPELPFASSRRPTPASPIQAAYQPPVNEPVTSQSTRPRRSFRMLVVLAMIYRVMAGVIVALWAIAVIMMLFGVVMSGGSEAAVGFSLVMLVPMLAYTVAVAVFVCVLLAIAELIHLAIAVESNTFDAAYR